MVKVMYVTEEEKKRILDMRMEQERKAKRRLTPYEKHHKKLGCILVFLGICCLYIGGELIIGTFVCGFLAILGFSAKEVEEEWLE